MSFIQNSCLKNVLFSATFLVCQGPRYFLQYRTFRAKTGNVLGKPDDLSVTVLFFIAVDHGLIYKFVIQLIPRLLGQSDFGHQNLLIHQRQVIKHWSAARVIIPHSTVLIPVTALQKFSTAFRQSPNILAWLAWPPSDPQP